ncbi:putative proteinase inhibitor I3, Kunitz legume, kunitz inhibitor STI-like superfamily [Helianthus anomalus]
MKTTFSSIFLNIFLFTTTISPLTAIIHDSSGNKLLHGIPYYILPLLRGSGGGLTVSQTTKTSCPLNITQEPFEVNRGIPFTFNPIVLDEQFIRGAYPLSIEADVINPCSGSKIWKVTSTTSSKNNGDKFVTSVTVRDSNSKKKDDDDDDNDKGVDIVTTGGEFNKPESCFQIVEDVMMPGLQSYQIQNCPFKCGGSSGDGFTCYNVGVVTDVDGNGYLGRTDAMFPVVFESSYSTYV